jgi:hypothetical protein
MKKYRVKLLNNHTAKPDQIIDGCLGNSMGNGKIQTYTRGEAIKKAYRFVGKIEEVKGIHNVIGTLSIQSIPENALLHGVVLHLVKRTAFLDATSMGEKIYQGDVFEAILGEIAENPNDRTDPKVLVQLEELTELISADYVLITQS